MESNYVFLTRGEISLANENCLYIHLKEGDKRIAYIKRNITNIKAFFINPNMSQYLRTKHSDKIDPKNWYEISFMTFDSVVNYCGYCHFSFKYNLDKKYKWDKGGVFELETSFSPSIEKFEKLKRIKYE